MVNAFTNFQSTDLANSVDLHRGAISTGLNTLQDTTRSLLDQGTREDVPTGMTPRKRVWEYVDKWELTKTRDALLQSYEQGQDHSIVATPMSESASLPEVIEDVVGNRVGDENDSPPEENTPKALRDYPIVSLSLSTSSTATLAAPPEPLPTLRKAATAKSGLPTMAALADRPTNILGPRGSRRVR